MQNIRSVSIVLILLLSFAASGCLKTRAQLRDDGSDAVPARVEPVAPQGGYAIEEIKQELTRMTGRLEELERAKDSEAKSGKREEQLKSLENRVHELEQAQIAALEAIKKIQSDLPPPDQVDLFTRAKEQHKSKNYDDAIQLLSQYLKNTGGKHYEEALMLRGESFYAQKNYKKAIVDFSKFPEKLARSPFAAKALLRIGQSFDAMGSKEDAVAFYEQVIDEYPKSPEAKEAKKKVARKKLK